jgi:hypothetical protein
VLLPFFQLASDDRMEIFPFPGQAKIESFSLPRGDALLLQQRWLQNLKRSKLAGQAQEPTHGFL